MGRHNGKAVPTIYLYEAEKSQTKVVPARSEDRRKKTSEKSNECGDGR